MDMQAFFTRRRNVFFLAVFMYFLWGSAFPSVKLGYELLRITTGDFFGQLVFAGVRFFLAGVAILLIECLAGKRIFSLALLDFQRLALYGLFMTTVQYICFYAGIARTSGVKASIMTGTSTFFSVLLAHFFFKNERLRPSIALGCFIGFAGVVMVNFHSDLNLDFTFGELLIAAAALVLALGGIFGKFISRDIEPALMTGWQLAIGGGLLLILGFAGGGAMPVYTAQSGLLMAYLVFISAAAFSIMAVLLKYNPVGMVTVFNFSTPVFGVALSGIVLGDSWLEWKNLFALLLVSIGIYLVTSAPGKERTTGEGEKL